LFSTPSTLRAQCRSSRPDRVPSRHARPGATSSRPGRRQLPRTRSIGCPRHGATPQARGGAACVRTATASRAFLAGCGAALGTRPPLRDGRKGGRERRRRRPYVAQVAGEMLGPIEVPRVDVRAGRDERGDLAAPAVHGDAAQPRRGYVTRYPLVHRRVGVTTPLSTPSYTRRIATAAAAGNFQETSRKLPLSGPLYVSVRRSARRRQRVPAGLAGG
jgi:hypothetical protein